MVDKKSGEKSKTRPRFVKQDQVCIARLRTAGTICLETFKDFPQMGRFTLRDEGKPLNRCLVVYLRCRALETFIQAHYKFIENFSHRMFELNELNS